MRQRREDFPFRTRRSPLDWVRAYPLFALAGIGFLAVAGVIGWKLATDIVGTDKFVIVEFHALDRQITTDGVSVSIDRVTLQPAFDIRISRYLRTHGDSTLFIDGRIENMSEEPLAAFVPAGGRQSQALLSGPGGQVSELPVRMVGTNKCATGGGTASIVPSGKATRFSIAIPVESGSVTRWVRESIKSGLFPQLSLGGFAFSECQPDGSLGQVSSEWRVEFEADTLNEPELRDYYPFGPPTGQTVGLNGRRYWSDWVPRAN